jgi:2-polyprenyl-6-hydroxyphenyl methylase/3-demethylubiquinone-9 3-methyltransferase
LFVAIYNDQGWISSYWHEVKRIYNHNAVLRAMITLFHAPYLIGARFLVRAVQGRLKVERGMSLWYDMLDWLGGWPFETAKTESVIRFYEERGFRLLNHRSAGRRHGCNEFVFERIS